jgi:hypothetical protein
MFSFYYEVALLFYEGMVKSNEIMDEYYDGGMI